MNRRKLLAGAAIGVTSIAGCFGYNQVQSIADTDGVSGGGDDTGGDEPSIPADEVDGTDTPPEEREETTPEGGESNNTDTGAETPPDQNPTEVVEIVGDELVFEEAADPNYESDELYITGTIRNTGDHPLQNVRFEGYVKVDEETVGTEYLEYATIEASSERQFELPFFVENPEAVDGHDTEVTAAQWA